LLISFLGVYLINHNKNINNEQSKGLMLLIEFEDTIGLNNFVYQMSERDIPGLLMVNAEYVEQNCNFVKGLKEYNIEIAGVVSGEPFWDLDYDIQYWKSNKNNRLQVFCI
jgi:hypothetical protein